MKKIELKPEKDVYGCVWYNLYINEKLHDSFHSSDKIKADEYYNSLINQEELV